MIALLSKQKGGKLMGALIAIFSVIAIILLLGMIGDRDANNRKNYTYGFCTIVLAITLLICKFL